MHTNVTPVATIRFVYVLLQEGTPVAAINKLVEKVRDPDFEIVNMEDWKLAQSIASRIIV